MSRNGGPGAWIFIPYIFPHIPVPKRELLTLESREIQLYPRHLNKEQRYRREMVKKGRPVNPVHAARSRNLPRANWNNRGETPVRLQLMHGSGSTPSVVATDLGSAFSTAQCLRFHTSLIQLANRVAIVRALGKSEVHCLHPGSGDNMTCSLSSALRWGSHRQGWFEIWFIHKVRHTMVRSADYEDLLWVASHRHVYAYQSLCGFPMAMLAYVEASTRNPQSLSSTNRMWSNSDKYYDERDSLSHQTARWLSRSQVVLSTVDTI